MAFNSSDMAVDPSIDEIRLATKEAEGIINLLRQGQPVEDVGIPANRLVYVMALLVCGVSKDLSRCLPHEVGEQRFVESILCRVMPHCFGDRPRDAPEVLLHLTLLVQVLVDTKPHSHASTIALSLLNRKVFVNSVQNVLRTAGSNQLGIARGLINAIQWCLTKGQPVAQAWAVKFLDQTIRRLNKAQRQHLASLLEAERVSGALFRMASSMQPKDCVEILHILTAIVRYHDWTVAVGSAGAMESAVLPLALRDIWAQPQELRAAARLLLVCMCKAFSGHSKHPYKGCAAAIASVLSPAAKSHGSVMRAASMILFRIMSDSEDTVPFCMTEGIQHVASLLHIHTEIRLLSCVLLITLQCVNHHHPGIAAGLIRAGVMTRMQRLAYDVSLEQVAEDPFDRRGRRDMFSGLIVTRLEHEGCRPATLCVLELSLMRRGPGSLDVARFMAASGPLYRAQYALLDLGGLDLLLADMTAVRKDWPDIDTALSLDRLVQRLESEIALQAGDDENAGDADKGPLAGDVVNGDSGGGQRQAPQGGSLVHGESSSAPQQAPPGGGVVSGESGGTPQQAGTTPSAPMNDPTMSDVTFIVEGRAFHARKGPLAACSEMFESMFGEGFVASEGQLQLTIPDVPYAVWEVVMTYAHTGTAEIPADMLSQVLHVAIKYMVHGLESLCQQAYIASLGRDKLAEIWSICHQLPLRRRQLPRACVKLALSCWSWGRPVVRTEAAADRRLWLQMEPELREWLTDILVSRDFGEGELLDLDPGPGDDGGDDDEDDGGGDSEDGGDEVMAAAED